MPLDTEQIEADLAAGRAGLYGDAEALRRLIAEVKRLQADLATANKVVVSLLGENADLVSRLRALRPEPDEGMGGERSRQ